MADTCVVVRVQRAHGLLTTRALCQLNRFRQVPAGMAKVVQRHRRAERLIRSCPGTGPIEVRLLGALLRVLGRLSRSQHWIDEPGFRRPLRPADILKIPQDPNRSQKRATASMSS